MLRLFGNAITSKFGAEKTTQNDILLPLCQRYGVNLITGLGELSYTRCVEAALRAKASGLPVRILYLSDFDPGGRSMPVAVARKIEFELRTKHPGLDIQVRPIFLTLEQCPYCANCRAFRSKRASPAPSFLKGALAKARPNWMHSKLCVPARWREF